MQLRDILRMRNRERGLPRIRSVPPEVLLLDALKTMARHALGALVVSTRDRFIGLVTLNDVLQALSLRGAEVLAGSVDEIMNAEAIISRPDDAIEDVRRLMFERCLSHVPVIDEGRLLDVISRVDVADAAYAECQFENQLLKHYIKGWPDPDRAT
ncbi:CBS domain-containing protein [Aromatoleum aromaticum]|nr:CBS domain-containing protein [Aromatoleum aromaticum]